jgi:spore maturation protein SpmA
VRELHVACGVKHNGLMLDVHSRLPRPCTMDLAQQVLRDVAPAAEAIVYEFMPEAVPGLGNAAIANTLQQMRLREWR